MAQSEERAKAIILCRKLSAQTVDRGCTESQSQMAMERIGNLLQQFDLTMDEISLSGEECKKIEVGIGTTKRTPLAASTAVAVANFCDCVVYYTKDRPAYKKNADGTIKYGRSTPTSKLRPLKEKGDTKLHFYGITSDVEMAAYLMATILEAARTEVAALKKTDVYKNYPGNRIQVTNSFMQGFSSRTDSRLNELKDTLAEQLQRARDARVEMGESTQDEVDREAAAKNINAKGSDLVVMKRTKVESDFKAKFGWSTKYRSGGRRNVSSHAGYNAGSNAAGNVNLSRPVGGGGYQGQLLLK